MLSLNFKLPVLMTPILKTFTNILSGYIIVTDSLQFCKYQKYQKLMEALQPKVIQFKTHTK
jgi:hypothetical protein